MKTHYIFIFLISLGLMTNCNEKSSDSLSPVFQSFDPQQVRLEGEFGRRMDLMIDPESISEPITDETFRPNGLKCKAILANEGSEITFTEFIDPSGIKTFFYLSEKSDLVEEDEFVTKQY